MRAVFIYRSFGGIRPAARCATGGDLCRRQNEDGQLERNAIRRQLQAASRWKSNAQVITVSSCSPVNLYSAAEDSLGPSHPSLIQSLCRASKSNKLNSGAGKSRGVMHRLENKSWQRGRRRPTTSVNRKPSTYCVAIYLSYSLQLRA